MRKTKLHITSLGTPTGQLMEAQILLQVGEYALLYVPKGKFLEIAVKTEDGYYKYSMASWMSVSSQRQLDQLSKNCRYLKYSKRKKRKTKK